MKVKELLDRPEKWTQGCYAVDENDCPIWGTDAYDEANHPKAVSFCLSGALKRCYPQRFEEDRAWDKLEVAIRSLGLSGNVIAFNDNPDTTFEMVKEVLELADV